MHALPHSHRNQRWVWRTWWWWLRWVSCYFSFLELPLPAWIRASPKVTMFIPSLQNYAVMNAHALAPMKSLIAFVQMLGSIHATQHVNSVIVHAQKSKPAKCVCHDVTTSCYPRCKRSEDEDHLEWTSFYSIIYVSQMDKANLGFADNNVSKC